MGKIFQGKSVWFGNYRIYAFNFAGSYALLPFPVADWSEYSRGVSIHAWSWHVGFVRCKRPFGLGKKFFTRGD